MTATALQRIPAKAQPRVTRDQALSSAALLVATLYDKDAGVSEAALSLDGRDNLESLKRELDALGLLDVYRQPNGALSIWCD